jgi:putative ABC transport system permease protein
MGNLGQDLRFGLRTYVRRPGFTLSALATIALGVAANATMFSAVHAVLLRPLPYAAPERLVWMEERTSNMSSMSVAYPNFLDYREQGRTFERMAAFRWRGLDLTGQGDPERLEGYEVSWGFFETMGVPLALGRTIGATDDHSAAAPTAILSHALWTRRFGADPAVIGRAVRLDGRAHVVIGVTPEGFRFPDSAQLWTPLGLSAHSLSNRDDHAGLSLIGRLADGVRLEGARADLDTISGRLAQAYPRSNEGVSVSLTPLTDRIVGETRPMLLALLGAVGLVLLIACANVSNLLLVRTASRRKEIAVRAALGAGRSRVLRQLLTESLLLTAAGGVAGALLAMWLVHVLRTVIPSYAFVPRLDEVAIDGPVLAFTAGLTAVVAALCGILPSLRASKLELTAALKGARVFGSASRLHRLLVVGETALAVVVLAGGGLLVKSFVKLVRVDPGFSPADVLILDLSPSSARYSAADEQIALYDQLLERLGSQPAVRSVAVGNPLPFSGASSQSRALPEEWPYAKESTVQTDFVTVSPRYFEAMGIPLIRGRDFGQEDTAASPPVVVVGEATARRFWPGQDPVGKRMCFEMEFPADGPPIPIWREVVGVVGHVKHYALSQDSRQQIYVSHRQMPLYNQGRLPPMTLVLRAEGGVATGTALVRESVLALDKDLPVHNVRTLESALAGSIGRTRLSAWLMSTFGGAALLLAVIGIFGLVSYAVSQRTAEIGVRIALGAGRREVWRLFIGEGMKPVLAGSALGLAAAVALTRGLEGLLFEVSPTDPLTYGAATLLLAIVALAASWLPARRATSVDPVTALRAE